MRKRVGVAPEEADRSAAWSGDEMKWNSAACFFAYASMSGRVNCANGRLPSDNVTTARVAAAQSAGTEVSFVGGYGGLIFILAELS